MSNRRKNNVKVNKKVLIATVDIGKKSNYGYWRSYTGADCKAFEFANTREGFDKFWRTIRAARIQHKAKLIIFGFESTGSYGEPLVHYMRMKPVKMVQTNPMHTKRVKELNDNSPRKTDSKDPRVIADIIQLGHYLSLVVPRGPAAELRRLSNARESSVSRRTAMLNRLQDIIGVVFPEFLTVMKGVQSKSAQYILKRYTLPGDIVRLGRSRLAKKMHKVSRGQLGSKRAAELFAAAKDSIGVTEGTESICMEIRQLLADIATDNEFIDAIEAKMSEYLTMIPYNHSILSIKGISTVIAAGIIGEVADFSAFHSAKALVKLAGLTLYEVSSGMHKGKRKITKRGRALLRKLLYFAALNVVKKDGILHAYYQRLINRGMLRMKAVVAVMRKLIIIIYALVRNETVFKSEYSIKKAA